MLGETILKEGRMAEVALIEEVPGVPEDERWFIWERSDPDFLGRGKIWSGATREAGEAWAAKCHISITVVELFGNDG